MKRNVSEAALPSYHSAWLHLRNLTFANGAKAWRFTAADNPTLYLEFLEFPVDADPRGLPEIKEASAALERYATGRVEEWLDANIQ